MLKRPKKIQVVVRVNEELVQIIDSEAERIGRTRTEVVIRAIESYVETLPKSKASKPTKPA